MDHSSQTHMNFHSLKEGWAFFLFFLGARMSNSGCCQGPKKFNCHAVTSNFNTRLNHTKHSLHLFFSIYYIEFYSLA